MSASVRVVDARTGRTRWPEDVSGGYPVAVETAFVEMSDEAELMRARQGAYRAMADQIAKLFYKWKPEEFMERPT